MEQWLFLFYAKARTDSRIGATHVSLYIALLHEWLLVPGDALVLERLVLMEKAKIFSRVTYHRCLRLLHEGGYIHYRPSPVARSSTVRLLEFN